MLKQYDLLEHIDFRDRYVTGCIEKMLCLTTGV